MSIINKLKSKFNEMFPNDNDPSVKPESLIPYNVHVKMLDGTIEEYSGLFFITDGVNCMKVDGDPFYHTVMSCRTVQKAEKYGETIKAMTIKQAKKEKMEHCYFCQSKENDAEEEDDE